MPNIYQRDKQSKILRENGSRWCGPAAISNTLVYLAKRYFQMLVPPIGNMSELEAQAKLIETLATHMKTNDEVGTDPINLVEGLEKYVRERGYKIKAKWRGNPKAREENLPTPMWIMNGIIGTSNAVLNIGGYEFNQKRGEYRRLDGHYLTVAGFSLANSKLITHDTARGGKRGIKDCTLEKIDGDNFAKDHEISAQPAEGFYKLHSIYLPNTKMDFAIIDGAVVFEVAKK
ncbi:MAG: hypothetical protein HYR97_02965 [Candidatus Melainabacteria bacterium]|nr:hypothetical protein [Candidatus Melainabacteria bacterium]